MKHRAYVVGLMFDPEMNQVALIRKLQPEWQAGKLNGIGGETRQDEDYRAAMVREFAEETGLVTAGPSWRHFLKLTDNFAYTVQFFAALGPIDTLQSPTAEEVRIVELGGLRVRPRADLIDDLAWIIPLALAVLRDNRPGFCTATFAPSKPEEA